MGQEARCLAHIGERVVEVKALLETDELILRGEHRARLPFASLDAVEAVDGRLMLHRQGAPIVLELGPAAEHWAAKIRNPPTLLDKLGVKAGQRIAVVGVTDGALLAQLHEHTAASDTTVTDTTLQDLTSNPDGATDTMFDQVFAQIDTLAEAQRILPIGITMIVQAGAVWVVYPKGRADLKDTQLMEVARAAGLVDNKGARISDTHTALRFVIPKANRRPAPATAR